MKLLLLVCLCFSFVSCSSNEKSNPIRKMASTSSSSFSVSSNLSLIGTSAPTMEANGYTLVDFDLEELEAAKSASAEFLAHNTMTDALSTTINKIRESDKNLKKATDKEIAAIILLAK